MGPLDGVKIIELAGVGPCPMCGMLLAELGATVLRLERIEPSGLGIETSADKAFLHRSRPSVAVDLKQDAGHIKGRTAFDIKENEKQFILGRG